MTKAVYANTRTKWFWEKDDFWQLKMTRTSLPEYIEGLAKGTLRRVDGELFEKFSGYDYSRKNSGI